MTMEAGLVERSRETIGRVHSKIIKKRSVRRRPEHRRPAPARVPTQLQRLFVSCQDVFKGPGTVPLPGDVQKLCHILDGMMPEDVGLCPDSQFFNPENPVRGSPRVTQTTIYKCDNFSLCMFFLPANGVIPLHNHPGMTVFSKLLVGTMHIKAYDWAAPLDPDAQTSQSRLARLKSNSTFTAPCDTSVLYPTSGGNIHAFTAITPCAVLDVMGPPYSHEDGRDCSYYKEIPQSDVSDGETAGGEAKEEGNGYGWLEEIEVPEDSHMDGIEYLGPQVYS